MKARIKSCADSMYWYSNFINQEFKIERFGERYVWVREPNEWRCLNFIEVRDIDIVEEKE